MNIGLNALGFVIERLIEAWTAALAVGVPIYGIWVINHWPIV